MPAKTKKDTKKETKKENKFSGEELEKQLRDGIVYPLYILYGEEKIELKDAVRKLIKKLSDGSFTEFNLNEFTDAADIDTIADAALALPFMSDRKLVVVSDYNINGLNSADYRKLNELLDNLSESTSLIFTYPTANPSEMKGQSRKSADSAVDNDTADNSEKSEDSEEAPSATKNWTPFLKKAAQVGAVYEYRRKSDENIEVFIAREVGRYECKISRQNIEVLRKYAGYDTNLLRNEIQKIAAGCAGREITRDDIERLASKTLEARVFDIFEAIVNGNFDRAFGIVGELLQMGEEPIMINSVLSTSFVNMYRVRCALLSGLDYLAPREYDKKGYRLTKDRNKKDVNWTLFFAEKNLRTLNLSDNQLRLCLGTLVEADSLMKSSRLDASVILQETIGKLLLVIKGENRNAG